MVLRLLLLSLRAVMAVLCMSLAFLEVVCRAYYVGGRYRAHVEAQKTRDNDKEGSAG